MNPFLSRVGETQVCDSDRPIERVCQSFVYRNKEEKDVRTCTKENEKVSYNGFE